MNKLFTIFLKAYNPKDKELFLKAKFTLITTLSFILSLLAIQTYTLYIYGFNDTVIISQLMGFSIMIIALGMLIRGAYNFAVHSILTTGFATTWVIMFSQLNNQPISSLDTIVFIVVILASMPLLFFKDRGTMIFYYIINYTIFLIYNYYIKLRCVLTPTEHLDYFFDNSACLFFAFFISYTLFSIYQQALTALTTELDERKKIQKELATSQKILAAHLQNTPVGAISIDLDFNITEWNPAAEIIFGYTKHEALGKNILNIIVPPDNKEALNTLFKTLLSGCGDERRTGKNIAKSGKKLQCDWYNTVLHDIDGKVLGLAFLINDVTDRKKTEELIIQSEKMMSIGGLAAGMAHELNNPLSGMMLNAQVIHQRLTMNLPANDKAAKKAGIAIPALKTYMEKRDILQQLENINQAGRHAAKIIDNMLSFARKNGSIKTPHNLDQLVESSLNLAGNDYSLRKKYNFRQIEIIRQYSPDLPAVLCEASKIQQVMFNIIKNASESMGMAKDMDTNPQLTFRIYKKLNMICLEIEDNGPGMDNSTRKRIFEPFFTTKEVDKGTGLGLSVSYFIIVDNYGGNMYVESTLGKGTKFIIELPIDG